MKTVDVQQYSATVRASSQPSVQLSRATRRWYRWWTGPVFANTRSFERWAREASGGTEMVYLAKHSVSSGRKVSRWFRSKS